METTAAPQKKINVSDVVSEAFSIFRANAAALLGAAIVVLGLAGLIEGILQSLDSAILGIVGTIIRLAAYMLYIGFVVRLVQDVRDGKRDEDVESLFSAAAPAVLPLIGFGILYGIGVTIGLILLIIPGLVALTFWSVGAPSIVIERQGVFAAFGRSWNLVRGDAWSVFATLLVTYLIVVVVSAILFVIGAAIGAVAVVVAAILAGVITAPVFSLVASILFFDLGGGAPAAATEFQQPPPVEPPLPPATP